MTNNHLSATLYLSYKKGVFNMNLKITQQFYHLANKHGITGKHKKKLAAWYTQLYFRKDRPTYKLTLGKHLLVLAARCEKFILQEKFKINNPPPQKRIY